MNLTNMIIDKYDYVNAIFKSGFLELEKLFASNCHVMILIWYAVLYFTSRLSSIT